MNWAKGQPLQNGKYVIEKRLGTGGFGITYKARHTFLNYDVVIKTPNEDVKSDPAYAKYVERFIKEGRMLAQLSNDPHPHIVRISDWFQEGDTHCLVMDFIQGESLWHLVGRRGALPETEAVEYIRQISSALSVVHQKKLVHLDITPPNIMVRNNRTAVLIDFGIAADMSPPSTLSRSFGNQAFAPYELVYKASRHRTVDIYCLAASLYYAVTGQCPTKSFDRKYEGVELKAPKRLVPQISDEVNRAILKGMELEPENRPQSMQEWLKLLEPKQVAPVTPQPVQTSPQRSDLRNGSSIPRPRPNTKFTVLVGVGVVVALMLAALAGVREWQHQTAIDYSYSQLENLLAHGEWKEADRKTSSVMLKVAGREEEGWLGNWLGNDSIQKFSCTDLRTIDNLWVKYSDGRFGFSVQKRIWESVGGTPDAEEIYRRFGDRIQWRVNNNWLTDEELTFSVEAPEGHLPAPFVRSVLRLREAPRLEYDDIWERGGIEERREWRYLMSRLVECSI